MYVIVFLLCCSVRRINARGEAKRGQEVLEYLLAPFRANLGLF